MAAGYLIDKAGLKGANYGNASISDKGAIWILCMESDGTVASEMKICSTQGGFSGGLDDGDRLTVSLNSIGDLSGDGIPDLVAGARHDDDGGFDTGAVWVLFLGDPGSVGLQENKTNELRLHPNPTTGTLTIEGAEGIATVYDMYGRLVVTTSSNTLNISQAAMGIYFVRVLDEQGRVYSQKVVKD